MKIKPKTNERMKTLYNLYAVFMTAFVSAICGFGLFWFLKIFSPLTNVFVCIFFGMMFSALLYDIIKPIYPIRK